MEKDPVMIKKIKNLDPQTKTLIKVVVTQVATIVVAVAAIEVVKRSIEKN